MEAIRLFIKTIPGEHIAVVALLLVIFWLFRMVKDRDESLRTNTKTLEHLVTLIEILVYRKGGGNGHG